MRRLRWIGSSLDELSAFPKDVKRAFGYFLRQVQIGATPPSAKPLRQFGAGVFELRDAYQGDAYRAVYVVKLVNAVYVLHAFKKKSTKGIGLPKPDVALIEDRLKRAQAIDAANGD
ncbi:MAG: type II toxin-antitoxin system RelE/ParE family toxin [Alphaproteobacteria bacterium]|nr:type II toxin-antitoxin system RelE/ParE family toxin [Alphaproteobacteria bacterium]